MNADKTLALITARGGSKGLPRKNLLIACGKPLIAWTIEAAHKSKAIDRVILSSDDDEIIKTALNLGCEVPFRRPADLASDISTSMDVVMHAINELPGYDYIVLLQPTSPLRIAQDIDEAFALLKSQNAPCCVSVCESEQSPYWMYQLTSDRKLESFLTKPVELSRRQDLPPSYVLNGAIYIAQVDWLRNTRNFVAEGCIAYIMPKERSIDIDTTEDFEVFRSKVENTNL
jgi:CMP-N,N'-diacetyllegionaminic acid synthase